FWSEICGRGETPRSLPRQNPAFSGRSEFAHTGIAYFGSTIRFRGFGTACGDPGACVTPEEVTVNTYSLAALRLRAYTWFELSQKIWSIGLVVSNPVYCVIGLAPLKLKI